MCVYVIRILYSTGHVVAAVLLRLQFINGIFQPCLKRSLQVRIALAAN